MNSKTTKTIRYLFIWGLAMCVYPATVYATITFNNDRTVYPVPPPPPLPAAGGVFNDPTFGTPIMRLTDSSDGAYQCHHEYSNVPAFNKDSTQIYVYCEDSPGGQRHYKIIDIDPVNFKITGKFDMNIYTPSGDHGMFDTWSGIDPNIIYWVDGKFMLYAYNTRTRQYTLLKDLHSYVPAGSWPVRMSVSTDNDNYFSFVASTASMDYARHFVWKRDTDQVILSLDRDPNDPNKNLYKANILSKGGDYLSVSYNGYAGITSGVLQSENYDLRTGQVVRRVYATANSSVLSHGDSGRDYQVGWSPWFNDMLRLTYTGDANQRQTIFDLGSDWSQAAHTSFRNADEYFAIREGYDDNINLYSPTSGFLHNEIFAFATDGSGNFRRLVHHHSFLYPSMDSDFRYWSTPRTSVSMDGKFIAWTSDWENQGNPDWSKVRLDVFIAKIDGSSTPHIVGDFNNDGLVNSVDLSMMTAAWNTSNSTYDLNHDGTVNSLDYTIMVQNWSV